MTYTTASSMNRGDDDAEMVSIHNLHPQLRCYTPKLQTPLLIVCKPCRALCFFRVVESSDPALLMLFMVDDWCRLYPCRRNLT